MRFFLIRHASAFDSSKEKNDAQRRLTEKGKRQSQILKNDFDSSGIIADAIFTSPAFRALQTAEIINGKKRKQNIKIVEGLYTWKSAARIKRFILQIKNKKFVFLVGHNPVLSELVSHLLDCPFKLPKSGVLGFSIKIKNQTPEFTCDYWDCGNRKKRDRGRVLFV